ncbi:hypothetical protein JCM19241_657 [Vibrio ishigakensis]|uniref:Uncharacterized protein n=1 Tax=Vibrio ishigakensis TaxID=1481914 RepID=A0A0B8QV15_9VIBR|nr:hypothetical protein JCM19241_657 [Vibrio ishigakensis]
MMELVGAEDTGSKAGMTDFKHCWPYKQKARKVNPAGF